MTPTVADVARKDLVANLGIAEIEKSAATIYLSKDQMRKFSTEVAEADRERQLRSKKR